MSDHPAGKTRTEHQGPPDTNEQADPGDPGDRGDRGELGVGHGESNESGSVDGVGRMSGPA